MSISMYDKAVTDKVSFWFKDRGIQILSPDDTTTLFQTRADQRMDAPATVPFIALSRAAQVDLQNASKRPMTFDGKMIESVEKHEIKNGKLIKSGKTIHVNVIPMTLTYQIDLYTANQEDADEYIRTIVFTLINKPKIVMEIPYNENEFQGVHRVEAYLTMQPQLNDGSDIPTRLYYDQFRRWSIRFTIEDAYLFDVPVVNNVFMELDDAEVSIQGEVEKKEKKEEKVLN